MVPQILSTSHLRLLAQAVSRENPTKLELESGRGKGSRLEVGALYVVSIYYSVSRWALAIVDFSRSILVLLWSRGLVCCFLTVSVRRILKTYLKTYAILLDDVEYVPVFPKKCGDYVLTWDLTNNRTFSITATASFVEAALAQQNLQYLWKWALS